MLPSFPAAERSRVELRVCINNEKSGITLPPPPFTRAYDNFLVFTAARSIAPLFPRREGKKPWSEWRSARTGIGNARRRLAIFSQLVDIDNRDYAGPLAGFVEARPIKAPSDPLGGIKAVTIFYSPEFV